MMTFPIYGKSVKIPWFQTTNQYQSNIFVQQPDATAATMEKKILAPWDPTPVSPGAAVHRQILSPLVWATASFGNCKAKSFGVRCSHRLSLDGTSNRGQPEVDRN